MSGEMEIVGFGDMDFEEAGFWTGLTDKAIPYATVMHNLISRPGSTPVFGTPTIVERRIPVTIGWSEGGGYSSIGEAFTALIRSLRPLDTRPRQLRAMRDGSILVAMDAVVEIPMTQTEGDVNTLQVVFITVDTEWTALSPLLTQSTIEDVNSQLLALSSNSLGREPGRIRYKPTTQRASGGEDFGYTYHRSITLTNSNVGTGVAQSFVDLPVLIPLGDTSAWVTAGKAEESGDDFRIIVDGREIPRTLKNWNTTDSGAWVIVENLPPQETITFDLVYGNPLAGTPTTLEYPNAPAFDMDASENHEWVYRTDDSESNDRLGLWYLSQQSGAPSQDRSIPGSWQIVTTRQVNEDYVQALYTEYEGVSDYYIATFDARRSRIGGVKPQNNRNGDGVALFHPCGISGVTAGFSYQNQRIGKVGSNPVGKFVILTRSGNQPWTVRFQENSEQHASATDIASDSYAFSNSPKSLAFAVWPFNNTSVHQGANANREIRASLNTDLTVNITVTPMLFGFMSDETEIYEVAVRIVTYEDGTDRGYRAAVLGYESGGRLFIPLGNTIVIDGAARTVEEWNSDVTERVRTVPTTSYAIRELIIPDNQDDAFEQAGDEWPTPPFPTTNIGNDSFTTNLDGWTQLDELDAAGGSGTAVSQSRDTSVFATTPASLKTGVSAYTGDPGGMVLNRYDTFLAVNGRYLITLSAFSRSTTDDVSPLIGVAFYDEDQNEIDTFYEDEWTPTPNEWVRRIVAFEVPEESVYFRVLLAATVITTNGTGTVNWDNVRANGSEIAFYHLEGDVPGDITIAYTSYPTYP